MTTKELTGKKRLNVENAKVDIQPATDTDVEKIYITGYANTKGHPDAYGDVPQNYNGNPVYVLDRFLTNPVLLVNHDNSVESIAGRFVEISEDDVGLKFKALLMTNAKSTKVQHAIEAYKQGFGVALSIGGQWFFEDETNPNALTKAVIHEISLVAVGADPEALTEGERAKAKPNETDANAKELIDAVKAYRNNPNLGNILSIEKLIQK